MYTLFHTIIALSALTFGTLAAPLSFSTRLSSFSHPLKLDSQLPHGMINTTAGACLPSGNSTTIQSFLVKAGDAAVLCPNSTFDLYAPVNFTAPNQVLTTLGSPTGNTRAMLIIRSNFTAAVQGSCDQCSGAVLSHVQVNGNRAQLGRPPQGGSGLIEMGGNTNGQVVANVRSFDPRGFSCLHMFEGANMSCRNATVVNNDIGPCGESAETDFPQAALEGTGRSFLDGVPGTISSNATSGRWADGISMACPHSLVANNQITDASDGGIVIFGAFGSTITNNHILALNQTLLGGINLVDSKPSKNYTGVLVTNNTVHAQGDMIKVGIGCGPAVWGDDLVTRNFGATVINNTLAGNHMGYGVLLSGVANWTAHGNVAAPGANFSAAFTDACHGLAVNPAAVVMDPSTVEWESSDVQSGAFGKAQFAICVESIRFVRDLEAGDDGDNDGDDNGDDDGDDNGDDDGDDDSDSGIDCSTAGTNSTMTWTHPMTATVTTTSMHGGASARLTSSVIATLTSLSSSSSKSSSTSTNLPSDEIAPAMGGGFDVSSSRASSMSTSSSSSSETSSASTSVTSSANALANSVPGAFTSATIFTVDSPVGAGFTSAMTFEITSFVVFQPTPTISGFGATATSSDAPSSSGISSVSSVVASASSAFPSTVPGLNATLPTTSQSNQATTTSLDAAAIIGSFFHGMATLMPSQLSTTNTQGTTCYAVGASCSAMSPTQTASDGGLLDVQALPTTTSVSHHGWTRPGPAAQPGVQIVEDAAAPAPVLVASVKKPCSMPSHHKIVNAARAVKSWVKRMFGRYE